MIGLTASRLNSRLAKAGVGLLIQSVAVCKQAVRALHLYKVYVCCSRPMSISSGISIAQKMSGQGNASIIRLLRGDLCTLASRVTVAPTQRDSVWSPWIESVDSCVGSASGVLVRRVKCRLSV